MQSRKGAGVAEKRSVSIGLTTQALDMLRQLADTGLYGATPADVAERFIDAALQAYTKRPWFEEDKTHGGPRLK